MSDQFLKYVIAGGAAAYLPGGASTCRVCNAPVRAGLIYCAGLSKCWKEGEGIISYADAEGRCLGCGEGAPCDNGCTPPDPPPVIERVRVEDGNVVATDVASGKTVQLTEPGVPVVRDGAKPSDGGTCGAGIKGCVLVGPHVHVAGSSCAAEPDPISPPHYKLGGIEVILAIEAWGLGFNTGNAIKYIARAGKKDPAKTVEDLRKAEFYLKREIANLTKAAK